MQDHRNEALVVKDPSGDCYVIPPDLLEQLRVSEEQRAELEQALDDVSGHFLIALVAYPIIKWAERQGATDETHSAGVRRGTI